MANKNYRSFLTRLFL